MQDVNIEKRAPLFILPLSGGGSRDVTQQQLARLLLGNKPIVAFDIQGGMSSDASWFQPSHDRP